MNRSTVLPVFWYNKREHCVYLTLFLNQTNVLQTNGLKYTDFVKRGYVFRNRSAKRR